MMLRLLAITGGLGLLAATAHVTVTSVGGYGTAHAVMIVAIAIGVGVGALVIGAAWSDRRRVVSVGIAACLACGEMYGILGTAERLTAQRDAAQAPAREAAAARAAAAEQVRRAEAALASLPTTNPRLTDALAAKVLADQAATAKASEKHCSTNCRQLLEQQVTAAALEVINARNELDLRKRASEQNLAQVRDNHGRVPSLPSGTPLADRLGIAPWILDLVTVVLGSFAANGLGGFLLAFGAHRPARAQSINNQARRLDEIPQAIDDTTAEYARVRHAARPPPPTPKLDKAPLIMHVDRFATAAISKKFRGRASLTDVHVAYLAWCRAEGVAPATAGDFAEAIGKLVKAAGITVRIDEGREPLLLGVQLESSFDGSGRRDFSA